MIYGKFDKFVPKPIVLKKEFYVGGFEDRRLKVMGLSEYTISLSLYHLVIISATGKVKALVKLF